MCQMFRHYNLLSHKIKENSESIKVKQKVRESVSISVTSILEVDKYISVTLI